MEGYMLSVGYPVGVNAKNQTYIIEIADGVVELQSDELLLWATLKVITKVKEDEQLSMYIQALIDKKVVYAGETLHELFYNIQDVKLYRQGCFSINDGKYAIVVGKEILCPTLEQDIIWKYADGTNTIGDILKFTEAESHINEFMENVNELLAHALIIGR